MTPFLPDATVEGHSRPEPVPVLNLTVTPKALVRVLLPVAHQCFDAAGNETASSFDRRLKVNPVGVYGISSAANELFVLGCSIFIYAGRGTRGLRQKNATTYAYFSGCVAYCNSAKSARDGKCDSIVCCHVDIPPALTDTRMRLGKWPHAGVKFSLLRLCRILCTSRVTFGLGVVVWVGYVFAGVGHVVSLASYI